MKIGVMSDTHDRLEEVEKAIKLFQKEKVELIIHCGDWVSPFVPQFIYSLKPKLTISIKSVFGNNEGDHFRFFERKKKENWNIEFYKESFDLEIDGKKIVVYHGSSKLLIDGLVNCGEYDAMFQGHTHEIVNEYIGKTLHLNPGTTSGYVRGGIVTNNKTVAIYNSGNNKAEIINL